MAPSNKERDLIRQIKNQDPEVKVTKQKQSRQFTGLRKHYPYIPPLDMDRVFEVMQLQELQQLQYEQQLLE